MRACVCVFLQLMSKETPVSGGNDSYVDLDRQVLGSAHPRVTRVQSGLNPAG